MKMTTQNEPRRGLTRVTPIELLVPDLVMRDDSDGTTLVGYAAVFDRWADIDSWEGRFIERLKRGAFTRTIGPNRGKADGPVRVLFNHGFDPSIGMKPLGANPVMKENSRGLWTETRLDPTSYNEDLKALLRSGALSGMSFTFDVLADEWELDGDSRKRTITEVKLYEFGPVTWPAYTDTTTGLRSREPDAAAPPAGTARGDQPAPVADPPGVPLEVIENTLARERELAADTRVGDTDGDGRNPEAPV